MIGSVYVFAAVAVAPLAVTALPAPAHPAPYDETPKPYGFEYGVHDNHSGANFNQHEAADGKLVTGSYQVLLPDGRTQIVSYKADSTGYGGYIADVKYDGKAVYKPAPKPVYKPKPYHA